MSLDELVDRLSDRGLVIPELERAARYLRHIGYYRLSPYTIPFQQGQPEHVFCEGTGFDDVLERAEVAVRAALTDHMSTTYADPHWYMDATHFGDRRPRASATERPAPAPGTP